MFHTTTLPEGPSHKHSCAPSSVAFPVHSREQFRCYDQIPPLRSWSRTHSALGIPDRHHHRGAARRLDPFDHGPSRGGDDPQSAPPVVDQARPAFTAPRLVTPPTSLWGAGRQRLEARPTRRRLEQRRRPLSLGVPQQQRARQPQQQPGLSSRQGTTPPERRRRAPHADSGAAHVMPSPASCAPPLAAEQARLGRGLVRQHGRAPPPSRSSSAPSRRYRHTPSVELPAAQPPGTSSGIVGGNTGHSAQRPRAPLPLSRTSKSSGLDTPSG